METKAPTESANFDQIYKYVVIDDFNGPIPGAIKEPGQIKKVNQNTSENRFSHFKNIITDSALGVGQIFSSANSLQLWQYISPRILQLGAGSIRALGGITTAATSGYRIINTYLDERASGTTNFNRTRKEVFVSTASISSGFLAGSLAGGVLAGATVLGAPAIVLGGIGAAGIIGVGYAASWTRDWASNIYDKIIR